MTTRWGPTLNPESLAWVNEVRARQGRPLIDVYGEPIGHEPEGIDVPVIRRVTPQSDPPRPSRCVLCGAARASWAMVSGLPAGLVVCWDCTRPLSRRSREDQTATLMGIGTRAPLRLRYARG